MKNYSKSKSYDELIDEWNELQLETKWRHIWLFLYSSRHAKLQQSQPQVSKKHDQLDAGLFKLLKKFDPEGVRSTANNEHDLKKIYHAFSLLIIYAFHRKAIQDGFIDYRYEDLLSDYFSFMEKLTPKEMLTIESLHELSYRYGFIVTHLWDDLMESDILTNQMLNLYETGKRPSSLRKNIFIFTKEYHPKGVQISIPGFTSNINEEWDLIIYFNRQDTISSIKNQIENIWEMEGIKTIGDKNNYHIALHIKRNLCTVRRSLDILAAQIKHLDAYNLSLSNMSSPEKYTREMLDENPLLIKESKKNLENLIKNIRLSEGITHKHWGLDKNNIRRAISLSLWDHQNMYIDEQSDNQSRRYWIKEIIENLRKKYPKALDLYLGIFNEPNSPNKSTIFGDSAAALDTVIREMEADYVLTARCIEACEYISPYEAKKSGGAI